MPQIYKRLYNVPYFLVAKADILCSCILDECDNNLFGLYIIQYSKFGDKKSVNLAGFLRRQNVLRIEFQRS